MRPNSVLSPVANTTARPVPEATLVPMNTRFGMLMVASSSSTIAIGGLADRVRLAGEGDVVGRELVLAHEASIGADAVALLEHDDVAGDEVGGGDDGDVSVADDLGVRRHELLQRLGGLLGAVLLEEADGRVEQHDAQDRDGDVDVVLPAGAGGEHGGDEDEERRHLKHDGEQAGELVEELVDDRPADLRRQDVLAVLREARERLVLGETLRRGTERLVDPVVGQRPDVGCRCRRCRHGLWSKAPVRALATVYSRARARRQPIRYAGIKRTVKP